jgi:hypothetical protein
MFGAADIALFRTMRTLRALRPLRAVSRWEGMRVSGHEIIAGTTVIRDEQETLLATAASRF